MHEAYTRTGKITYSGGHTNDELTGIEIEMKGIPVFIMLEKDGFKSTVETSEIVKLNVNFEYDADASTALDALIAAAFEAKRSIESRHQSMANDLRSWANDLKALQKRCRVCNSTENLEAHHLESKHYSPSLMLSLGNGIVLCAKCHNDFHAFCGAKRASRHEFYRWLQSKGKTISVITPQKNEKTSKPIKTDDLAEIIKCALKIEQETGKLPGRRRLAEAAGCSDWKARRALEELKNSN
jgi:hypothetical protein